MMKTQNRCPAFIPSVISMLLGFVLIIIACSNPYQGDWKPVEGAFLSKFAGDVRPDKVLPEYPRPQMMRDDWMNLNGLWEYAIRPRAQEPDSFDGKILVPFPAEAALSGVGKAVGAENTLWYRRTFQLPADWEGRTIVLRFGAVDWESTLWVNGRKLGSHRGGYDAFYFDITDALKEDGPQEIILSVWDPVNDGYQPRGKQVKNPRGIWYTSVTGIWQTVWLEPLPKIHISSLKIVPDIDTKKVSIQAECPGIPDEYRCKVTVRSGRTVEGHFTGRVHDPISISIFEPRLWHPADPFLYDLTVALLDESGEIVDEVAGYFGMRKISLGKDDKGFTRMMLNNEPFFQFGPLDQGWWPDGLYMAPTDEALRYDIEVTQKLGFNMARKHVKIEPERWYYWCDKLGLLVWQDMPSGDEYIDPRDPDIKRSKESATQFEYELKRMVEGLGNHPSIVVWVPYNEGWGQWDTPRISRLIKSWDPARLVNPASGWTDRGSGDILDIHAYPGPAMPETEEDRAIVLGEFGGLGLPLGGHTWQDEDNWGYRNYKDQEELIQAYRDLIKNLEPYKALGLSAAVYTQTTDVEIEVNGLMTYDRAVIKMNPKEMIRINQGFLPPIIESKHAIFLESLEVTIYNVSQEGDIRYTVDGSEPTKRSSLYIKPFKISETATVKARTFWSDGQSSDANEVTVIKVGLRRGDKMKRVKSGLKVSYYENDGKRYDKLPDFTQLESKWTGVARHCDLIQRKREDNFGFVFEGYIRVPTDGIYTFYSDSDDGSQLFIGSDLIVDNDYTHGMTEKSGEIALSAGFHPFKLTFFQGMGGKGLEVRYGGAGLKKQKIPPRVLFHKR